MSGWGWWGEEGGRRGRSVVVGCGVVGVEWLGEEEDEDEDDVVVLGGVLLR